MIVPVGNWYHRRETHLWRWQLHLLDLFFNQKETLNAVTMLLCLGQANYHEFSLAQLTFSDTRNMLSIVLGAKQRCANGCVLLSERNYTKLYGCACGMLGSFRYSRWTSYAEVLAYCSVAPGLAPAIPSLYCLVDSSTRPILHIHIWSNLSSPGCLGAYQEAG